MPRIARASSEEVSNMNPFKWIKILKPDNVYTPVSYEAYPKSPVVKNQLISGQLLPALRIEVRAYENFINCPVSRQNLT